MKRIIILLTLLNSTVMLLAQKKEGVITFEEKINMHKMMKDDAMKAMVPEFRSSKMELYFRGEECLYKAVEEDDEQETGGGGVRMVMRRPQSEIYRNFATEKRVEQREAMGKKYLIVDTLKILAWKLTSDSKKILNYDCIKATYNDTARKQNITAWFTDAIELTAGPNRFSSLPGMILAVEINDGEMMWTATNVDFKKIKDEDIKAPTKGELIKEEDFRKKMEEMRQRNGGGNIRIMRN